MTTRFCIGGPRDGQNVAILKGARMMTSASPSEWDDYNLRTVRVNGQEMTIWIHVDLDAAAARARLAHHLGEPLELEWTA